MNDRFTALADDFITRVRGASIGPATEVILVYYCTDETGKRVPAFRVALEPTTVACAPGEPEDAKQFATSLHVTAIIDSINSLVRHAPERPVRLRYGPRFLVKIIDFSLEIRQPTSRNTDTCQAAESVKVGS